MREGREETRSSVTDCSNQLWLTHRLRTSRMILLRFSLLICLNKDTSFANGNKWSCCSSTPLKHLYILLFYKYGFTQTLQISLKVKFHSFMSFLWFKAVHDGKLLLERHHVMVGAKPNPKSSIFYHWIYFLLLYYYFIICYWRNLFIKICNYLDVLISRICAWGTNENWDRF